MSSSLINGMDSIFMWLSSKLKQNLADYCDLETAQDSHTLVAHDGSLCTLIRIDGVRSLTGHKTFYDTIVQPLNNTFGTYLDKKGHTFQFWFSYDPSKTRAVLARMLEPNLETCRRLNLDLSQMFEERMEVLPKWASYEENYLVLWTDQSALSKSENKESNKKRSASKAKVVAPLRDAQDPYAANVMLMDRHNTFVSSIVDELLKCDIILQPLNVYEACCMIRHSVDDEFTNPEWQPSLPSDPIRPQIRKTYTKAEQWDIVWPKLSWQVCPRDAKIVDDRYVQIGNKIFAPIYIDLMPKEIRWFKELFLNLLSKKMPWRISYNIAGDGLAAVALKGLFASILSFTSQDNRLLNQGVKALKELQEHNESVVKIRISLCTWVDLHQKDDLARRLSELSSAVQNWGGALVSDVTGDPVAGFISSTLGTTRNSIATTSAAPLNEVTYMLPLSRPASAWSSGGVIFRSPEGKLLPYQPGSPLQATWINLIFAGPGSGKSVLMNALNLALATKEGNKNLPKIGIIDIGPSSSGLISLIQDALPSSKKHLAKHYRIRMTDEFSVNPFDTQLGCRFPTAEEAAFLKNFLTLIVTDPNEEKSDKGMVGLVSMIIEEMYLKKSDKHSPSRYNARVDLFVDDALKKCPSFRMDNKTTWWEVVDELFKNNFIREAYLAQRYAVPLLSDTTEIAQEDKIKMIYSKPITSTSENLIEAFTRGVSEALDLYRILGKPTKFDIGESRITALDLDEVAKTGGPIAERQTAIMYLLARYLLAKDYKIIRETVNEMPYPIHRECPPEVPVEKYKNFHLARVMEMRDDIKRLCFDEFHRTSKSEIVREQVVVDMREGRKWSMDIILASQSLQDFDERMREFTTSVFVMNGGNEETVNKIGEVFGIKEPAERAALLNGQVHPPKKGGGTFLAKFYTTKGNYTQLLSYTLGPVELWAFSTTTEEVQIRDRMYRSMGAARARKILAAIYPSPSDAREEILNRKMRMKDVGISGEDDTNVYEALIKEILEKYGQSYKN